MPRALRSFCCAVVYAISSLLPSPCVGNARFRVALNAIGFLIKLIFFVGLVVGALLSLGVSP